jgi:hypothetical protein
MLLSDDALTAVGEARLLHQSQQGYFCIARALPKDEGASSRTRWSQSFYPTGALDGVAHAARNQADTYISQASFISARRAVANAKMLRCVYVDLDVYNLGLRADDATVMAIDRCAREAGLPEPTYITSSGRGLYAKWVFKNSITSDLLPQWQTLQDLLIALYRSLGSDAKVKDAARVLRLAQTINSKNGASVQVVRNNGVLHSFRELCAAAAKIDIPLAVGSARQQGQVARRRCGVDLNDVPTDFSALANYSAIREPILMRHGTVQTLNWARFLDLRDLAVARGGIRKGERDITLFWMTSFLAFSGVITPGNLWNEVRQLLLAFPVSEDFDPLNDASLSTLVNRITAHDRGEKIAHHGKLYSPIYTPRNQLLLEMLEITPEEERGLRTIISSAEKQRRADGKVPGRADRRQDRSEARSAAVALQVKGHSVAEIADLLGHHRSTVHRWLQPDTLAGTTIIERRGRRAMAKQDLSTGFCTIRLTGAGPVPHPRLAAAQESQKSEKAGAYTSTELARRTKLRKQKAHLTPDSGWDADALAAWLEKRKAKEAEMAAHAERAAQYQREVEEAKTAQAALATQVLITDLRQGFASRSRKTADISNSQSMSVSCGEVPVLEQEYSSRLYISAHQITAMNNDVLYRIERLRADSAAGIDMAPGEPELPGTAIPVPPRRRPVAAGAGLNAGVVAQKPATASEFPPASQATDRLTRPLLRPPSVSYSDVSQPSSGRRSTPAPAAALQEPTPKKEEKVWPDDDPRPAGSQFSVEAWDKAEAENPGCIIFEMHKPSEVGLVAVSTTDLDGPRQILLRRSLLLGGRVADDFPFRGRVCAKIEHWTPDMGTFHYQVIRSHSARLANPEYDGSVLRNYMDKPPTRPGAPQGPGSRGEPGPGLSRAERYGAMPK